MASCWGFSSAASWLSRRGQLVSVVGPEGAGPERRPPPRESNCLDAGIAILSALSAGPATPVRSGRSGRGKGTRSGYAHSEIPPEGESHIGTGAGTCALATPASTGETTGLGKYRRWGTARRCSVHRPNLV